MDETYQAISILIKNAQLSDAVRLYMNALNQSQINVDSGIGRRILIPSNIDTTMTDFFSKNNYQLPIRSLASAQERFSLISLFAVFGAIRGISVLLLLTRTHLDEESLKTYFILNPFTTKTTKEYVSVNNRIGSSRTYPEDIYISTSSTFRAIYNRGLLIRSGKLNETVISEGLRSLNRSPHLQLIL